jgi:tRNA 2-thiouridine synthesizing protein B
VLHTVNKSPFEKNAFADCLRHAQPGSTLLLIEDGVYAAMRGTQHSARVEQAAKTVWILALRPDVEARGLQDKLLAGIALIDYDGFVDLVVEHTAVMPWL